MVDTVQDLPTRSHGSNVHLRSGQAARMAGVPVATLRVWERRYGAIDAPKTRTGQRLYAPHDVQRLRLLKQLTNSGHAIGTIATLDLEALQALADDSQPPTQAGRDVVVVGRSAGHRLRRFPACALKALYDDLDQAERATDIPDADVWVVHLPTLQPSTAERVLALRDSGKAPVLVVIYGFGTEAVAESLRSSGVSVRRDPVSGRELARMVAAAAHASEMPPPSPREAVAPRRFTDDALTELIELPSSVACECPRHLAEIVIQLAGFERYSAECQSRSPSDALLHEQLTELAGTARTLFEQALERVVIEEGLQRPAGLNT